MNAAELKELVNTVFEGLISLATIIGSGYMIAARPDSTTVVGVASAAGMAVITFWFGQRGQVKAVNGNISAMADIANKMLTRQEAATQAQTQAHVRGPQTNG